MSVLVIAEVNNQGLKPSVANLVGAALKVGADVDIFLLGCAESAQVAAKQLSGVRTVYVNPDEGDSILSESLTNAVVDLVKTKAYSHVFFEASSLGKSVMPRVAALLDVAAMSDVIDIVDEKTFVRPIFAGAIEVTLQNDEPVKIATIRATAFVAPTMDGAAEIEVLAPMVEPMKTRKVSFEAVKTDRPALQTAASAVVKGRRDAARVLLRTMLPVVAPRTECFPYRWSFRPFVQARYSYPRHSAPPGAGSPQPEPRQKVAPGG